MFKKALFLFFSLSMIISTEGAENKYYPVIYIQPKPGARDITVQSKLLLKIDWRWQHPLQPELFNFQVRGEQSGIHSGDVVISDNTVIFKPHAPFSPAEKVHVSVKVTLPGWEQALAYHFTTTKITLFDPAVFRACSDEFAVESQLAKSTAPLPTYGEMTVINGVAVPGDFPLFEPSIFKEGTAPGKIFLNNWIGSPYIMIFENDGTPYFYQRVEERARDFKLQANGLLSRRFRHNLHCFVAMDSNYALVDTFRCTNGYDTDEHELIIEPDGHYFLIALGYRTVDMSKLVPGGKTSATIIDNHVQEFDANHNLVFEWLCFDYFDIRDAVHENLKDDHIDYLHMNSIAVDYDGHIIISSRHLSEITKIDRQTGDIIWRLGGGNNEFDFVNDEHEISYQHHVRPVPGKSNHYTAFDNGNYHQPQFSRAVEFKVDTQNMTATKVWEYPRQPGRYSNWMGNAQRLANGNTFINWADGSLPKATEVTPEGEVVYEGDFVEYSHCYRAFRFEWESVAAKPYLIIESLPDRVTLIFNKFGDTNVKEYIIYGGRTENSLVPIDTTVNTYAHFTNLKNNSRYYFNVCAVDLNGNHSQFSDIIRTYVNYSDVGENLLENGDFSDGSNHWDFLARDEARAQGSVTNGEFYVRITEGGSEFWKVQLIQENIPIIRGRKYLFEFEARATANKAIEPRVAMNGGDWTNYARTNPIVITRQKKHYTFEFEMNDPTDYQARVVLNCGKSNSDAYFDNVGVTEIIPATVVTQEQTLPLDFQLHQNYPNPFNPTTTIRYVVPELCYVRLTVYNIQGEMVAELVNLPHDPGLHQIVFEATNMSSGLYFYKINAHSVKNNANYQAVRKMMIVK